MKIVIYSKENCPNCEKSKLFLKNRNISYEEKKVGRDIGRIELLDLFPTVRQMPIIEIDGVYVGGYDELTRKLDNVTN